MLVSDYEAVYDLWMSCAGIGLNDLDDSKEGITQFLQRNPETCFVAEVNNKIVGSILAGNDGRRGYIYHTAVHPEYRRQRVASQLITTVLDALKHIGIHKIALVVFTKNKDGNAFWGNEGFSARDDLVYRNKALTEMKRIDT